MTLKNVLAGVAVNNIETAEIWYDDLLGRAPDVRPMDGLIEWQFPDGGWLQVFASDDRAGKSSVTLVEADFDARMREINRLGLKVHAFTQGEAVKTCIIHDPDGNQIVFAQGFDANHRSTR